MTVFPLTSSSQLECPSRLTLTPKHVMWMWTPKIIVVGQDEWNKWLYLIHHESVSFTQSVKLFQVTKSTERPLVRHPLSSIKHLVHVCAFHELPNLWEVTFGHDSVLCLSRDSLVCLDDFSTHSFVFLSFVFSWETVILIRCHQRRVDVTFLSSLFMLSVEDELKSLERRTFNFQPVSLQLSIRNCVIKWCSFDI